MTAEVNTGDAAPAAESSVADGLSGSSSTATPLFSPPPATEAQANGEAHVHPPSSQPDAQPDATSAMSSLPPAELTATSPLLAADAPGSDIQSPPAAVTSAASHRSATVKQRSRKPSAKAQPKHGTTHRSAAPSNTHQPDSPTDDEPPPPPALSQAELNAEAKAHRHRLALERPAWIERRRREEEERRENRTTRVRRWPLIDRRNVKRFVAERQMADIEEADRLKAAEEVRKKREEDHSAAVEAAMDDGVQQQTSRPLDELKDETSSVEANVHTEERKEVEVEMVSATEADEPPTHAQSVLEAATVADAEEGSALVSDETREAAADGEETEDEEATLAVDDQFPAPKHTKSSKKREVWTWTKKSKKRRPATATPPTATAPTSFAISPPPPPPPSRSPPLSPSAARITWTEPDHCEPGHFTPTLLLGNRVHFFDLQTRLPRDGDLLTYSKAKHAYQVRLDATQDESARQLKEGVLMRWLRVEEQEVWEYIDVGWCKHPDRGGVKSWWPCEVVRLYREGRAISANELREELMSSEDEEAESSVGQSVIVHLLGTVEDTRLFALPADNVLTWQEGLDLGCQTRPTKTISQALRDGEWLYNFHLSKWLLLENERRRRQAESVRQRPGEQWLGRRVSVLWEDDAQWYVGVVRQYNAITQMLCVLYEDNEVEWLDVRNVFVSDDAFRLPMSADNSGVNEETVRSAYRTFHLYDDEHRTEAEWDELLRVRARVEHVQATATVTADPAVGEACSVCWECGMVEDVYMLASQMGMRAGGLEKDKKRENVNCVRCSKVCHARCFQLMCGSLSHGSTAEGDEEAGSRRRAKPSDTGRSEGWQVAIDMKRPRCLDCLKCEHCGLFGAKGMRPAEQPQAEADETDSEPTTTSPSTTIGGTSSAPAGGGLLLQSLRSPADMLTCDVCDVRVHRQCLDPPISDEQAAITGGWVCRHCLKCRSCKVTAFSKEKTSQESTQPSEEREDDNAEELSSELTDPATAVEEEADEGAQDGSTEAGGPAVEKKASSHKGKRAKGKSAGKSHKKKVALTIDAPQLGEATETAEAADEQQPVGSAETPIAVEAALSVDAAASIAADAKEQTVAMELDIASSVADEPLKEPSDASAHSTKPPIIDADTLPSPDTEYHALLGTHMNGTDTASETQRESAATDAQSTAATDVSTLNTAVVQPGQPDQTMPVLSSQLPEPSQQPTARHDVEDDPLSQEVTAELATAADNCPPQATTESSSATPPRRPPKRRKKLTQGKSKAHSRQRETRQSAAASIAATEGADGSVTASTLASGVPSSAVIKPSFAWSDWSYDFTMCDACTRRRAAREYCPICCSLWDEHAMVECTRCSRWVHIACDPSASAFDQDKLSKQSVQYHCPDCVKREQAKEMEHILDSLRTLDRSNYFLNPVTDEQAPDYRDTIKTPMDFTTIYNRIHSLSYTELEQFKYDLNLVWRNAKDYNPAGSSIHRQAVRLQGKSMELLEEMMVRRGTGLERKEGRIEDKDEKEAEERRDRELQDEVRREKRKLEKEKKEKQTTQQTLVALPPPPAVNPELLLRDALFALPLDAFRFFYQPTQSGQLGCVDCCLLCGSMGDPMDMLACSDCGECMHWYCVDTEMIKRSEAETECGPTRHALTSILHKSADGSGVINAERRDGTWKCANCALCPTCGENGELMGTAQHKNKADGTDADHSHSDDDVTRLMIQCDLCDRPYHLRCLRHPPVQPADVTASLILPPFRCDRCVFCRFCGTRRPGKHSDSHWLLDYTACHPCGRLWEQGKYCPVCEHVWRQDKKSEHRQHEQHAGTNGLTLADYSSSHHNSASSAQALQCEACDMWVHVTCDDISPRIYKLLQSDEYSYYCPICRDGDEKLRQRWDSQSALFVRVLQDKDRRAEERRQRKLAAQDFLSCLYPPFSHSLQSSFARPGVGSTVFSSMVTVSMPQACMRRMGKLQLAEQIEAVKAGVRRVQVKRRRERRAWRLQEKRNKLQESGGVAARGKAWLTQEDGDEAMANGELELRHKQLEHFLTLCLPLQPTPTASSQHIALHQSPITLPPERPPSPSPPVPIESVHMANGDGHGDGMAVNDSATAEMRAQATAPRIHRSHAHPVPSPVLTFAAVLAATTSFTDSRECAFCHLHGDFSLPASAGRLLPAHPFHPLLVFVHVQCALWSSQPYGAVSELGQMGGVFQAIARTHNTSCSHCHQSGASLPCRQKSCRHSYHFHCAVAAGCLFTSDTRVFCAEHASAALKRVTRHELRKIERRMTVRVSRLEVRDGQLLGRLKDEREAEMAVDGEHGAFRKGKRRAKESGGGGSKKAKKSVKEEERAMKEENQAVKEEDRDEKKDDMMEADDDDTGQPSPTLNGHASHASSASPSASPSPSHTAIKQEEMTLHSVSPTPLLDRPALSSYHMRIGSLTIVSLGRLSSAAVCHSSHFLFPIGFTSYRLYWSYMRPNSRTGYWCEIQQAADTRLHFNIRADDDQQRPIVAFTAHEAFTVLLSRQHRKPTKASTTSAAYFFGFGLPVVMEQLDSDEAVAGMTGFLRVHGGSSDGEAGAEEVVLDSEGKRQQERQLQEAEELRRAIEAVVPLNPSGCARTEGYKGKAADSKKPLRSNFSSSVRSTGVANDVSSSSSSSPPSAQPSANASSPVSASSSSTPFTAYDPTSSSRHKTAFSSPTGLLSLSQQYRNMKSAPTRAKVGHSPIHEWGLYATEVLEAGAMVIEYLGETIRQKVADVRERRYEEDGIGSCYMFRIDDDLIVDATKKGNIGRFINHSCDPCCVTKIIDVAGEKKIVVITSRRVGEGEEITYDYFFANEADRIACNCGARNCAGRLN